MIRALLFLVLIGCAAPLAPAAGFTSFEETLVAAAEANGDFVVFYEGPTWLPETAPVRQALSDPAVRGRIAGVTGWAAVPAEALAEENAKKLKVKPDFIPYDLPALALADAEGITFAIAEGVTPANLPQALKALAAAVPLRVRRDALFASAKAATGVARAKLFGQGLDQLPFRISSGRKDIVTAIQQADPADASGYAFKYTFQAGAFHEQVTEVMIREKHFGELLARVDKHLGNPVLASQQRQALLSAKMQAYRAQDDLSNAIAILGKIVSLDPRSELGVGAVQYLRLLTEPVRLRGLKWESIDNRPTWLPMVADVSAVVTEPGTYTIEFRHADGQTRFRKVALKAGGKEIASDPNPAEARKMRLVVPAGGKGRKLELWAESCGTGWFAGRGDIVVTRE